MNQITILSIPPQIVNELASYGPFDLKSFIQSNETLRFRAELRNGDVLPKGMICTTDGIVTGIPAKNTQGNYEVVVTIESGAETQQTSFPLTIKPSLTIKENDYLDKLKSQVWDALEQHLPIPELGELLERPITKADVYYLLERWGYLVIWDAFNLDPPSEKKLLNLKGVSPHYQVFDRGSSIIGAPVDLFSEERTLADGLQTARAMIREIYDRNWTIEMAGLDKLVRAAWIEAKLLGEQFGRQLEIINYKPSFQDLDLYAKESFKLKQ